MSIKLSDSIRLGQQKPLDDKYFNGLVPYISTSQVNTLLPKAIRHIGLTVNINREEYWYKDGIEDENLVLKIINNSAYDLKNQEQDDRLTALEGEDVSQNDIINDLFSELEAERIKNSIQDSVLNNLEGIYYVWSPTNRTLTLYDREGTQLSQVSLVSLDNEGTDIRYNVSTLSLELYNANNELLDSIPVSSFVGSVGTQLQLNSNQLQLKDSQGNILSTVGFTVSNISGLQTALDNKLNTPTMTNNYYGLWDDVNKKFINGQLNQDTNGNIGIGATPTDSKVGLSPLVNQTALKVLNYSLTGNNIQPALDINGTWNTSGNPTLIKASVTNTTSNENTLLMDLQVNGASQFKVSKKGVVTFTGPLYVNSISNTRLHLMSFGGNGDESVLSNLADNSGTSGQKVFIDAAIGIKPTSGNSTLISFLSRPTINQTGGANGITRGLYINPTLTSAYDWRSIEWRNNTGYGLYGTGTANNFLAGNLGIGKLLPVEKLDVDGNVKAIDFKGQAVKFNLQTSISPTPNTLVPKTDGSGLIWYNNNSVAGELFTGTPFVYNVPSTITVNHVNAPASPDVPSYIQAIQNRLTQLHQPGLTMQKFTNWTTKSLNNTTNSTNVEGNTNIYTDTTIFNTNSAIATNTEVVSVHTNRMLPKNADWAILFNIKLASEGLGSNAASKTNRLIGIHNSEIGTLIIPSLYLFDSTYGYATHNLAILKNGGGSKLITSNGGTTTSDIIFGAVADSIIPAMILKVGDNILIQAQYGSTTISEIYSAQLLSGDDFGFCVTARKSSFGNERIGNVSNVRYYIFP